MVGALLLAALVLTAAAWLRGAEYDEQYTLFLTAGTARPIWPATPFPAGVVAEVQAGHGSLAGIARDLRATDVHPPLYFWAIAGWRYLFGPSLLAARMLSVLCGIASLALVGTLARHVSAACGAPARAVLITVGCYGFTYTDAIARGFAPAETLLLAGVLLLLHRRPALAGVPLGAACACNYLASFSATAAALATRNWRAIPGMLPFVALDAWFFAAQHGSRVGQFPPFELLPGLARLAEYQTAALFGALPLYANGVGRVVITSVIALAAASLLPPVFRGNRTILSAAAAPPVGLLLLGTIFNNTPIELRYLSFGLPFVAILLAEVPRPLVQVLQAASIAGLLFSSRTMQPARLAAQAANTLPKDATVLVPYGNDGVGIIGAFAIEARPGLAIRPLRPGEKLPDRFYLATLAQDRDSRAAMPTGNWREIAIGSNLRLYERICSPE